MDRSSSPKVREGPHSLNNANVSFSATSTDGEQNQDNLLTGSRLHPVAAGQSLNECENTNPFISAPEPVEPAEENIREVIVDKPSRTLMIPVEFKALSVLAVADTGAQTTVISRDLAKRLNLPLNATETVRLRNAQRNSTMTGKIIRKLRFKIGENSYEWDTVIADTHDDFILGYDFLAQHCSSINVKDNTLIIDGAEVRATVKEDKQPNDMKIGRVTLDKRTVVPPNSIKTIKARVDGPRSSSVVIESSGNHKGLLLPASVVKGDSKVSVCLLNDSDRFITLKPGHFLGTAIEADDEIIDETEYETLDTSFENNIDGNSEETIDPNIDRVTVEDIGPEEEEQSSSSQGAENQVDSEPEPLRIPEHIKCLYEETCSRLTPEQSFEVGKVLCEFQDVFAKHDLDLGNFKEIEHKIDTGDHPPIKMRMRRTPLGFQEEEEKHLKSMLDAGVIQPSQSDWCFAPVLVRKRDKSVRWCVDFRSLNKATVKDVYPLPLIEECMDTLAGVKYMSTLDMAGAYWQINIAPEDRHKTAFITKYGLFEHVKMAFGLTNAPATFQRAINLVLRGLTWKEVLAYLDDVVVISSTFEQGITRLREVLARFRKYNLKLKPRKCKLFCTEVDFLGKIVTSNGLTVPDSKIKAVLDWPVPTSRQQVQSFLGFLNYHRAFIKDLSRKAAPLYHLAKPKEPFIWLEAQQEAFETLKKDLVTAPVLAIPNPTDDFILDTDASDNAIGAELIQVQDGVERTIAYSSHVLSSEQRRYCTTRKELLAVVLFTREYRHYLLGRHFTVRTDHGSLTWLMNFKNIEGQLARWLEELSQYDMKIVHRSGAKHTNADALSRIPTDQEVCEAYATGKSLESLPCGGCSYCKKAHTVWQRFSDEVDDVIPLAMRQIEIDDEPLYSSTQDLAPTQPASQQLQQDITPSQPDVGPAEDSAGGADEQDSSVIYTGTESDQAGRWIKSYSSEQLREAQLADPDLKPIITWLEAKKEPLLRHLNLESRNTKHLWLCKPQLVIKDGVLYYQWETNDQKGLKLVVPDKLKTEVLENNHDSKFAGHMGQKNTLLKCRNSFYWPQQKRDVLAYVKSCHICNKNKKPSVKPKAAMVNYHAGSPFERLHIDILGPFMRSNAGNRYVLVMIDQFTKWFECIPIGDQSAEQITKTLLETVIARFGTPTFIHSDRGANFESNLFQAVCTLLQIAKTRTTAYRPSANGQVERMNRIVLHVIRCFLGKNKRDWDEYLPYVGMAIRATVNRSTGFTPNMMVFGREVTMPIDIIMGITKEPKEHAEYLIALIERLKQTHALARYALQSTQEYQKRTYDARTKQHTYEVGDLVYRLNATVKKGVSRKLEPVYVGPLLVTEVISPVLYRVEGRKKSAVMHHDRLRVCEDRFIPLWIRRRRHHLLSLDATLHYDESEQNDSSIDARPIPPTVSGDDTNANVVDPGQPDLSFIASVENSQDNLGERQQRKRPFILIKSKDGSHPNIKLMLYPKQSFQ